MSGALSCCSSEVVRFCCCLGQCCRINCSQTHSPGLDHRRDAESAFVVVQLFLLGNVCLQLLRLLQRIFVAGVRPEVVPAGSFAALILLGTLLLLLPTAAANPASPLPPPPSISNQSGRNKESRRWESARNAAIRSSSPPDGCDSPRGYARAGRQRPGPAPISWQCTSSRKKKRIPRESDEYFGDAGAVPVVRPICLAVKRKRLVDAGTIRYRADDRLYRKDRVAINCFHAIAGLNELFPNGGIFGTGFKMWGLNGTTRVLIEYTEKANASGSSPPFAPFSPVQFSHGALKQELREKTETSWEQDAFARTSFPNQNDGTAGAARNS